MKKLLPILVLLPCVAVAQNNFEASLSTTNLYGYSTTKSHNNAPQTVEINLSASHDFDEDTSLSLNLDINAGSDKEIKNYNNGDWGQEIYSIFSSNYGQIWLGETYNVATQFHANAQDVGPLGLDNSDIVNFITNPNWQRDGHYTRFSTLNSTTINTDGVAPKASYITPEFYGTNIGFTYTPDSFDKRGLIDKRETYSDKSAYIASILNQQNINSFNISSSLSYGYFSDNNQEISAGINIAHGGWNIGGGYRRSYADKYKAVTITDSYRESEAFDIGLGYEIGPYKASLTYFNSHAKDFDSHDEILMLSQVYQQNKWLEFYLTAAYTKFDSKEEKNEGYATITGFGLKF